MALIEGCKHSLEITVPETEVDQETERAAAAIQVKVRLPGFRPGKAPLAMVKTRSPVTSGRKCWKSWSRDS